MTETNFKNHASLRGTNAVSDAATQLREQPLAQSTRVAFTMAEILLSLTIIGVVAAITLPSLMANINERTWNTQRKALYARMSQALSIMPQMGGYGTVTEESGSITEDTAAEAFLTEGLSKVLKINNICDSEHLADCGVPTSYTNLAGSTITPWPKTIGAWNEHFVNFSFVGSHWNSDGTDAHYSYSQPNTKAAAFETQNGETIALYYNPNCRDSAGNVWHYSQARMCANFIYDLNGNKGPNMVGKDIGFITALYNNDTNIVAPMPLATNAGTMKQALASAACTAQDSESRLPNIDELTSMYYNKNLVGISSGDFWSGSVVSASLAWDQDFYAGPRDPDTRFHSYSVRCVWR